MLKQSSYRFFASLWLLFSVSFTIGCGKPENTPQPNQGNNYNTVRTGKLTDYLGELITIEGVEPNEPQMLSYGESSLRVDTVNGVKLDSPRTIKVTGFEIPPNVRCVLKGYETGCMFGQPNAEFQAAKELGEEPPEWQQFPYQWGTHFVVLIVVEPQQP